MNFTNLKYFLAVADELSFSRAAEKLYVTQQNLSNHISRLEDELQVTLFDRSPVLRLTYAGECMRDYARQLVATEQQMQLHLGDISQQRRARLRIGVTRTRGRMMLTEVLRRHSIRIASIGAPSFCTKCRISIVSVDRTTCTHICTVR